MKTFRFASGNRHKLNEMESLFEKYRIRAELVLAIDDEPTFDPEEKGKSYRENALIKAIAAQEILPVRTCFADDSGLEVDALGGVPGLHSARYAGANATAEDNVAKLLAALDGVETDKRQAKFVCHIAMITANGHQIHARGELHGKIAFQAQGDGGFGYDPIFELADGRSLASLSAHDKNEISHRSLAVAELAKRLKSDA